MHTVYLLCTKRQIWKLILKTSRLRLFRAIFSKVFVACNWFASYRQNVWKYVNVPENCSLSKVYRSMLQLFCIFFRSAADSADLSASCGDVGHQTGSCQCVALRTDFKFPPPSHGPTCKQLQLTDKATADYLFSWGTNKGGGAGRGW